MHGIGVLVDTSSWPMGKESDHFLGFNFVAVFFKFWQYCIENGQNTSRRTPLCELWSMMITQHVLIDFLLTVKAATLIFLSGRGSAIFIC